MTYATRSDSPEVELTLTWGLFPTGMSRNPWEVSSAVERECQGPRRPPTALTVEKSRERVAELTLWRLDTLVKSRTESL